MISIRNLTKRYGGPENGHLAVDDLSLEIPRGEFFCFLGPNGAGKTTTIRVLTGLARPTGGAASVGGFDVQREPVRAKALLGYIPDTPFLYERLTGREFMRFVAGLYSMPEDDAAREAAALLDTFGIGEVADDLVEHYSHGMRQKLSFASCFLHKPEVVVVDEPWVGLDPKNIRFVKEFLKEQTARGTTVFMSTHSLAIVEGVADRIGIISRGRLLHVGTLAETLRLARRPGTLEDVFLELTEEPPA